MFTVKFTGGEELAARLRALPAAASRKVQLAALRAAAEPMRTDMEATAPRGSGDRRDIQLAESMTISAVRESQTEGGDVSVAVGPSKEAFWGFFREFGHGPGAADPFARPAFDTNAPVSLTIVGQRLWDALRQSLPSSPETTGGRLA